jgi:hypothetical protein
MASSAARSRVLLLVCTIVGGMFAQLPAAHAAARTSSALRDANRRIEAARALTATGRLGDAVLATSRLAEVDPVIPSAPPVAMPGEVPSPLAPTVAGLLAAIEAAALVPDRAVDASDAEIREVLAEAMGRAPSMGISATGEPVVRNAGQQRLQAWTEAHVDRSQIHGGALLLARAIDAALPALRSFAATLPADAPEAPCSMANHAPVLCIGGAGESTYADDYALQIDMGGDDIYTNSNAGTNTVLGTTPVQILIDQGGNDTYVGRTWSGTAGANVQGSGQYGYGMLVDAAGNDTYEAVNERVESDSVVAQGVGALGAGMLADLGGSDVYRAINTGPARFNNALVIAQSYGTLGGVGITLDRGTGSDSYLVLGNPPNVETSAGLTVTDVQTRSYGWAVAGAATLWSDEGGDDNVVAEATSPPIAADDPRTILRSARHEVQGFGMAATGGAALTLSGPGWTSWLARAAATGPVTRERSFQGFGQGGQPSLGALVDTGGNDSYVVELVAEAVATARVNDACDCEGVEAHAESGSISAYSHGAGAMGGVGILRDLGGNDRYAVTIRTTARATATDNRTAGSSSDAGASAIAFNSNVGANAQGWAGDAAAALYDEAGNDVYQANILTTAEATAKASDPDVPETGSATTGYAFMNVQASSSLGSHVELIDRGGNDTYTTTGSASATAVPPSEVVSGTASSSVQGSVSAASALFMDLAVGTPDTDTFSVTPPDATLNGTRGQGSWVDGGQGVGLGLNA